MNNIDFRKLLEPHYNDALNYCRALCARQTNLEAEEILQQSLLKALEKIQQLREVERFRSWFFQIITRTFYDNLRKPFWKRMVFKHTSNESEWPRVYSQERLDEHQSLMLALSTLTDKERAALLLFEIGGFKLKEIQKIQGDKSESAVKSRLSRAREKLKVNIEQQEVRGARIHSIQSVSDSLTKEPITFETAQIISNTNHTR